MDNQWVFVCHVQNNLISNRIVCVFGLFLISKTQSLDLLSLFEDECRNTTQIGAYQLNTIYHNSHRDEFHRLRERQKKNLI